MQYLYFVILGLVCYFIGNFNGARLISKSHNKDVTQFGSGNPGTLNVWRQCGLWAGVLTFLFDMLKGFLPCLISYFLFKNNGLNGDVALYVAGFSVIVGHIFPVVFKFKGGKGVATAIGVFFMAKWWVALIVFAVMLGCMFFIKSASILTIGFVIIMSIVEICLCNPANWINYFFIVAIMLLIIYAHRKNILRLYSGKENKTELLAMIKDASHKEETTETADTEDKDSK